MTRVCVRVCVFSGADLGNIYDKGTKHMRYYYTLDLMCFGFLLLTAKNDRVGVNEHPMGRQ